VDLGPEVNGTLHLCYRLLGLVVEILPLERGQQTGRRNDHNRRRVAYENSHLQR
jgi:hypothetical protein